MTRSLAHDKDFYCDTFWDRPIGYYHNPAGRDLPKELLARGEDSTYVVLEPDELQSFVSI